MVIIIIVVHHIIIVFYRFTMTFYDLTLERYTQPENSRIFLVFLTVGIYYVLGTGKTRKILFLYLHVHATNTTDDASCQDAQQQTFARRGLSYR